MQTEDLVQIVLDPNLGTPWPEGRIDFELEWYKGRTWRVEYTFASPALPVAALSVGNEVRGVWRYEVVEVGAADDETPTVTLRVSPERRGADGYHFIAVYERPSLRLLSAERFEGAQKRPFELRRLPPLDQAVSPSEDGLSYTRSFTLRRSAETPEDGAAEDDDEAPVPGDEDLFADAVEEEVA